MSDFWKYAGVLLSLSLCGLALAGNLKPAALTFLGSSYHLAFVSLKNRPMWEFVKPGETVDNWTTLVTIIDRPDAKSKSDLDRLAQGIHDEYTSHGGRILMAKTMVNASGQPYNYMVAAFDQPALHRFELNFVKAALGPNNAYTAIYGVRISDPKDYVSKAKAFLNEHSGEIGRELEQSPLPDPATLPHKEL